MDRGNSPIEALSNPRSHLACPFRPILQHSNDAIRRSTSDSGAQAHNPWDDSDRRAETAQALGEDQIECLRHGLIAPAPKAELSEKMKRKAATRAAKLKSSSWYASATRSISIVKQ